MEKLRHIVKGVDDSGRMSLSSEELAGATPVQQGVKQQVPVVRGPGDKASSGHEEELTERAGGCTSSPARSEDLVNANAFERCSRFRVFRWKTFEEARRGD